MDLQMNSQIARIMKITGQEALELQVMFPPSRVEKLDMVRTLMEPMIILTADLIGVWMRISMPSHWRLGSIMQVTIHQIIWV
jgi:hypothetical protein